MWWGGRDRRLLLQRVKISLTFVWIHLFGSTILRLAFKLWRRNWKNVPNLVLLESSNHFRVYINASYIGLDCTSWGSIRRIILQMIWNRQWWFSPWWLGGINSMMSCVTSSRIKCCVRVHVEQLHNRFLQAICDRAIVLWGYHYPKKISYIMRRVNPGSSVWRMNALYIYFRGHLRVP